MDSVGVGRASTKGVTYRDFSSDVRQLTCKLDSLADESPLRAGLGGLASQVAANILTPYCATRWDF